jgi:DNA-binding transcriptional LysR family regulator
MNLDYLKTYLILYRNRNFTKTAKDCFLSQSTISSRISDLEEEYGCELFIRDKGTLQPTKAGILLAAWAEQLIYTYNRSKIEVNKSNIEAIFIGCTHAFYDIYLADNFIRLVNLLPDCQINLVLDNSKEIIASISSGELSIGITHHPCNYNKYESRKILDDNLVLVSSGIHPEYEEQLSIYDVKRLPLINTNLMDPEGEVDIFDNMDYSFSINLGLKSISLLEHNENFFSILPQDSIINELEEKTLIPYEINDYVLPKVDYYIINSKKPTEKEKIIIKEIEDIVASI